MSISHNRARKENGAGRMTFGMRQACSPHTPHAWELAHVPAYNPNTYKTTRPITMR